MIIDMQPWLVDPRGKLAKTDFVGRVDQINLHVNGVIVRGPYCKESLPTCNFNDSKPA